MRISTTREFRDTTGLMRSRTPILVTRRGRVARTQAWSGTTAELLEGARHWVALILVAIDNGAATVT